MNKKQLIAVWAMMIVFNSFVYANETYKVDLDNDGKVEVVTVEHAFITLDSKVTMETQGTITVTGPDGNKIDSFSMFNCLDKVEFVDLAKDGAKQIVAWSSGGAHHTDIAIYGYKGGKFYNIFDDGSGCAILADFTATPSTIKIGRPKFEEKMWSYGAEPDWEIWKWNNGKFIQA